MTSGGVKGDCDERRFPQRAGGGDRRLVTVLIAAGYLTLVWILFVAMMSARPSWYQSLLGPEVSWEHLQNVGLWAVAIFKMCIWLMALGAVWLTLWARQLGKR